MELILLIVKFLYYSFISICFGLLVIFLSLTTGDLIVGDTQFIYEYVKGIIFIVVVLFVLLLINRKSVMKGFEYVAFGKFRRTPIGMLIIAACLYYILDSIFLLLFQIRDNTFLKVVNIVTSLIFAGVLYMFLHGWYFGKKAMEEDD